ncbi:NUDIX hydrolase [Nocardioides limicola]|uniref:NUDIX hydrolase n=1 Tax=Nocardioides limicola TaxID=2803368 RepID=UPI00193C17E1|nr:NUDIX hydrolase [Nocardioides sp. DJM-14]
MDPTRTLPDSLVEASLKYQDGGAEPSPPRDAATVVLMRGSDGSPGGVRAYFLRRHVGMEFAAGMCVFPGGGVDPDDAHLRGDLWAGPSPEQWAEAMGCSPDEATALVCAAVRETFEESGVLLAGTPDSVVADTTGADWEADREALEARQLSMSEFLERRGLVLRSDLLELLGGWLTPVFEPKRYRTWFFVASLPEGQRTRDVSGESDLVAWLPIRDAIRYVDTGQMMMLPPTYATCCQLYDASTATEAIELARSWPSDMVEPVVDAASRRLVIPQRFVDIGLRVGQELDGAAADAGQEADA